MAWPVVLDRFLQGLDALECSSALPGRRRACAEALARLLHSLWPSSPLCACRLSDGAGTDLCALDESGRLREPWSRAMRHLSNAGVVPLPPEIHIPDRILLVERVSFRGRDMGLLALAVPPTSHSQEPTSLPAFLKLCARIVAVHLHSAMPEQADHNLQQERTEQAALADIGELAGPMIHESNNFLNVVLLQVAILDMEVSDAMRGQLEVIRRQGMAFKALLQQVQSRRDQLQALRQPVDLNRVVSNAFAGSIDGFPPISLELAPGLPPLEGSPQAFERLFRFLFSCLLPGDHGPIVRTEATAGYLVLRFQGVRLGDRTSGSAGEFEQLDWLVCQSLLRRLHGEFLTEEDPTTGTAIVVRFVLPSELPVERA